MLTEYEWEIAKKVCTLKQRQALDLYRRGWTLGQIARHLDVDRTSVRSRLETADRKLRKALDDLDCQAA